VLQQLDGKVVCKHCGVKFYRKPRGRPPKFCSDICRDQERDQRWLWWSAGVGLFGRWRSTSIRARREWRWREFVYTAESGSEADFRKEHGDQITDNLMAEYTSIFGHPPRRRAP